MQLNIIKIYINIREWGDSVVHAVAWLHYRLDLLVSSVKVTNVLELYRRKWKGVTSIHYKAHLAISTILIAFRKAILISYTFFFDNCFDIEERTRNKRTYIRENLNIVFLIEADSTSLLMLLTIY